MPRLLMMMILTIPIAGLTATPTLNDVVATALGDLIDRGDARAITVGLYDNGQTRIVSFGKRTRDDERKPQANTVFEIGSISKVFTSLLVQVQVDAGRLDWDDSIGDRLPGTAFASDAVAAITLRELATHSSGLPRLPDNMAFEDPLNPYLGYERSHLVSYLAAFEPADDLIKEYAYSNLGVGLLGEIAADAAGNRYAEAMIRDVLRPLGMPDSGIALKDGQAERLAHGFSGGADMPNWNGFDALAGAGALISTTEDMLRFVHQNLQDGELDSALSALRVPQAGGETAFGWHIQDIDGAEPVYWHNGGTGGYASFLAIRPDIGTGIVILSTSTEYTAITDIGFAQTIGTPLQPESVELSRFPGAYRIAEGFVLNVFIDGGNLNAQATGQGAFTLSPAGENEFVFPAADIRIVFDADGNESASALTMYQGDQVMPAPRVGDATTPAARQTIALSEEQLGAYTGTFRLAPGADFNIVVRNGQLFAQLTGQPAYPVFAYDTDRFFYKVVDAQLHFERGDDDSVNALVLHQGGEQRAPKID